MPARASAAISTGLGVRETRSCGAGASPATATADAPSGRLTGPVLASIPARAAACEGCSGGGRPLELATPAVLVGPAASDDGRERPDAVPGAGGIEGRGGGAGVGARDADAQRSRPAAEAQRRDEARRLAVDARGDRAAGLDVER